MFKNVYLFLILLVFSFFMHQKFSYGMKREDKVAWQHTHLSRQPKSAVEQSFIHQVRSLMAQHKLHEAKKIGKQMMKSNPTLVEGYYYTALAQFEQEEPENVEKMLSSLKKAEKNLQTAFTMALNDSSHASRETDVITQSMVQEAHQVVCQKKQYFCHLLNAKQAAEKGLRGKQSEECLQAWKTCPTHIETGYLASQLFNSLGDTQRCLITLNQICHVYQTELSPDEQVQRASDLQKLEQFRKSLFPQAQDLCTQRFKTICAKGLNLDRHTLLSLLNEMESILPESAQASYYKGWIHASHEDFGSAIPLFVH